VSDDIQIDELRDDIEETRDNMSDTLSQLEERLAPERLQQDTTDIVREVTDKILAEIQGKTGDLSQQITDQIQAAIQGVATAKSEEVLSQATAGIRSVGASIWDRLGASPAPAALAAIGIGLLAAGGSHKASSAQGADARSGVMNAVDGLLAGANSVAERATGALSGSGEQSDSGDQSESLISQAKGLITDRAETPGQLKDMATDQPLLAGLLALGLGVAMGLSMPGTEKERDLTSSLRPQLHDKLEQMGVASDAHGMMDQAKAKAGSIAQAVSEAATSSASQAKQAATDVMDTAKETAVTATRDKGLVG